MMEDEADYIIPLIIPRKKPVADSSPLATNSMSNNNKKKSQDNNCRANEDTNQNQTTTISEPRNNGKAVKETERGFLIQVTFGRGGNPPDVTATTVTSGNVCSIKRERSIQLSSHNIEAEAIRCQEQLESTRLILSGLDAEAGQLERTGEQLRKAVRDEDGQLMQMELDIQQLVSELSDCGRQAESSNEELVRTRLAAKTARTRRFETERVLRELQLNLCRRKLELATARATSRKRGGESADQNGTNNDEDEAMEEDEEPAEEHDSQLREEEEKIEALTRELNELSSNNSKAVAEMEAAERSDAQWQKSRTELQNKIESGRAELESRRQKLTSQITVMERHAGQLAILNKSRQKERLKEVELLQHQVLVEAARQLEELERAGNDLLTVG